MSARLSVAMIVRDEAKMVPGFLEAARGLWDELVVVDTGSTDDTAALFEAAGATIVRCPWSRDFAAARNVSLAHATGDWVLVLDADERVSPDFIAQCRGAISSPAVGALLVRMSHQLPYGHRRDAWVLRAWKRDPAIHYRHAIREDASDDVNAMLATRGLCLARVEAPVMHLGYVRDRGAANDKKARDAALLRERLGAVPGDFYCWLKLLELARAWQDEVLWRETARTATDLIELQGRGVIAGEAWGGELVAMIAEGLFAPESAAGLAFLEGWAERWGASPLFLIRRGFFREHQRLWDGARADYLGALAIRSESGTGAATDQSGWGVAAQLGLARLALAQHDAPVALAHARAALASTPRDPEALMAVASLTRYLEGPRALEAWIGSHEAIEPNCPERDWAIGEALLAVKDHKGAVAAFRRAAGVPPGGPAGLRLAQSLLASGQVEASERLARALLPSQPEAGLGVLLFDLAAGRDTSLELELTPETAHASLKQWVDVLVACRQPALLRRVRSRVAAVGTIFPWLPDYLLEKSA
ncbi:MAG: glycosyltransferase [Archangium sp.]|nr:glycosyltransferase [Archangium sp.]